MGLTSQLAGKEAHDRRAGGGALAAGGQDFEDVAAGVDGGRALRLAIGGRVRQVTIPARQQRPQALAQTLRCRTARYALQQVPRLVRTLIS